MPECLLFAVKRMLCARQAALSNNPRTPFGSKGFGLRLNVFSAIACRTRIGNQLAFKLFEGIVVLCSFHACDKIRHSCFVYFVYVLYNTPTFWKRLANVLYKVMIDNSEFLFKFVKYRIVRLRNYTKPITVRIGCFAVFIPVRYKEIKRVAKRCGEFASSFCDRKLLSYLQLHIFSLMPIGFVNLRSEGAKRHPRCDDRCPAAKPRDPAQQAAIFTFAKNIRSARPSLREPTCMNQGEGDQTYQCHAQTHDNELSIAEHFRRPRTYLEPRETIAIATRGGKVAA